jgi:hypothetical protein
MELNQLGAAYERQPKCKNLHLQASFSSPTIMIIERFLAGLHKVTLAYSLVNARHLYTLLGYLLCVINSSHTSRLTFSTLYTAVMDTLKLCM